jgi:MoaA/NifB/PqqE/SkfB family radical SAM enzyme
LGKVSSRQEFNEMFKHHSNLVTESDNTGYVKDFDLKFVDYRFSNICNLTCRICSPHFSSKWHADAISLEIISPSQTTSLIRPTSNIGSLWGQLVSLLDGLERIHFAGGEPLMMEEHYRILEYLISKEKTDVMITYNTNFSELVYKRWDVIEFWKHFKHISVCASLDGMGRRGELMRKGIKWDIVEGNRKRMLNEVPHASFQLTPTVSVMNVLHLPDFFIDWIEKGLLQPEELNIYLLFEPYFYNIVNLSIDLKEKVHKKYTDFFNQYVHVNFEKNKADYVHAQFNTVLTHMHSSKEFKPEGIAYGQFSFASYNKKLDELRNENFIEVFPELKSIL